MPARLSSVSSRSTPSIRLWRRALPASGRSPGFIADSLKSFGLETEIHEPAPGRTSVLGRLRGAGGGRSLMLNAHCDTVDVAGMAEPFSGAIRDGKVYGRGSFDMKGSLAA